MEGSDFGVGTPQSRSGHMHVESDNQFDSAEGREGRRKVWC